MSRLLFGTIMSLTLIGISYFSSKMYALGFRLETVATRLVFFGFLIVSLLFIGSVMLARTGSIGATLYREIQILAGIGFYLFIGAVVLGLCLLIGAIIGREIPVVIPISILALSLVVAGIGLVQSRFFHIVKYTITLPDAPTSWNGKTAVLISDTHFGLINHKKFSDKIVDAILALHPDFVLEAGDFYDGPRINTTPITESWTKVTKAIPVFMAPGNHEEYGDYIGFLTSIQNAGITVLDDKKALFDGVQIAGITYRTGKDPSDAKAALEKLDLRKDVATILINHPPTSLAAAADARVDLQVSGHTHNGQFWPMTYLIRRIYGPYYHGLAKYADMNVITTSGIGTFGPPMRLFNPPEIVLITFSTGK